MFGLVGVRCCEFEDGEEVEELDGGKGEDDGGLDVVDIAGDDARVVRDHDQEEAEIEKRGD